MTGRANGSAGRDAGAARTTTARRRGGHMRTRWMRIAGLFMAMALAHVALAGERAIDKEVVIAGTPDDAWRA